MPGPTRWRGVALSHAVASNKVTEDELDDRVRNVLNFINDSQAAGVPENAPETELNRPEDQALLRRAAAESIVLLKNEGNILPFAKSKTTAVIGPNSKIARFCGGGSASLLPYYSVSPYEGIVAQCDKTSFSQGSADHQMLPQLGDRLRTETGQRGFLWRAYNEPATVLDRKPVEERVLVNSHMFFMDYRNENLAPVWYCQCDGIFTPDETGLFDFGLGVEGTAKLYVDDELLVGNFENQTPGPTLFGSGTIEEIGSKELVAGQDYRIRVEWGCYKTSKLPAAGPVGGIHGGLMFGAFRRMSPEQAIQEAADLAATVDQVVLVVGLNGEWETEGSDRTTMDMSTHTNTLVSKVLAANPNTAVIVQSGTPVTLPWIDEAKAVCHAWYGGNETGNAIADVVFGEVNPVRMPNALSNTSFPSPPLTRIPHSPASYLSRSLVDCKTTPHTSTSAAREDVFSTARTSTSATATTKRSARHRCSHSDMGSPTRPSSCKTCKQWWTTRSRSRCRSRTRAHARVHKSCKSTSHPQRRHQLNVPSRN